MSVFLNTVASSSDGSERPPAAVNLQQGVVRPKMVEVPKIKINSPNVEDFGIRQNQPVNRSIRSFKSSFHL